MRPPRPKTLIYPVLGLLLAVLVLLSIVTVNTYLSVRGGREQAEHVLAAQASAICEGLAAGMRTGRRHLRWRTEFIQKLIEDMSQLGDVDFIVVLDEDGQVLAHTDPDRVGQKLPNFKKVLNRRGPDESTGWFDPRRNLYLYSRRLNLLDDHAPRPGLGPGMGPGMMMRREAPEEQTKPEFVLVGLKTKVYQETYRRQLVHSLTMGGLLFVLGSGAIIFIFVAQNYRTVERTLSNLSTYTAGIVDNMPGGLITVNETGEPVMVNRAARELFGWGDRPEKDLAGDPSIKDLWTAFSRRLAEGGPILLEEFETRAANGSPLPLSVSAASTPAAEEGGPGAVFMLRDLRQVRDLEEQVRRSEKLAAVGRLAAGVAHEVRNPLSSMRGLARFLSKSFDEQSREAEYLKVMVEEIDRLNRVISGLLDFARPRNPDLKPVRLNEIARHTSDLITDDARHQSVSLREDMSPENPLVMADRDQLIQAMLNVLLNAVEAMPDGGRMTVSTQVRDGNALFSVEDSGPGIPPEDRSRLSDPFFTTKKKGTGLGLALVARIVEAHGGRLMFGGEPGLGARVVFFLPLAQETEEKE